jgi:hypothetical protein
MDLSKSAAPRRDPAPPEDQPTAGVKETAGPAVRRCRCGHDKRHPLVRPEYRYSGWGTLVLGLFGSPTPERIDYVCGVCGEAVGSVTDRRSLSRFRHREPLPEER